ncbi:MAG: orotate phosphoribosyltransferase [Christensenellales bacterium]
MICSECGRDIEGEEVYYCPKCGKTLCLECTEENEGICPSCNKANVQMYN